MKNLGQSPIYGLIAGVLVGLLLVAGMWWIDYPRHGERGRAIVPTHDEAASSAFVDAWRRKAGSPWALELRYVRTLADGREFTATSQEAQLPPLRIRSSMGTIRAETANGLVLCSGSTDQTTTVTCRRNGTLPPFDVRVASEVQAVSQAVSGARRVYDVTADGGCFRLRAIVTQPDLPFGTAARYCFDLRTGAATESTLERGANKDTYLATSVNPDPPPSLFVLPLPPE